VKNKVAGILLVICIYSLSIYLGGCGEAVKEEVSVGAAPRQLKPLTGSYISATYVMDWTDTTNATKYNIQIDNDSDFSSPAVNDSSLTSSNYTPTGLAAGQYFWRVRAGNAATWTGWSYTWEVVVGRSFGDINGDGYSDVIAGAPAYNGIGADSGKAYIFMGGSPMNNAADATVAGTAGSDLLGTSVAIAGDVNGDGYADIVIGAYGASGGGKAYVFFGGTGFTGDKAATSADLVISNPTATAGSNFGFSVSSAGDVNGDGYDDIIIGAENSGPTNNGCAYIYFGGSSMNNTPDITLDGEGSSDYFGHSVSQAGDVNGDGYSDIIIGAVQNSGARGKAYIFFGGPTFDTSPDIVYAGSNVGDWMGESVSTAGDVNADGYADVVIGADGTDGGGPNQGAAYLLLGGASMDNIADLTFAGSNDNDYLGEAVSGAGDIDGDGYDDFIIGANGAGGGGTKKGQTFLFRGGSTLDNTADATITGGADGDQLGKSLAFAGDVNGDGFSDIAIGAPYAEGSGIDNGKVYIFQGSGSFSGAKTPSDANVIFTGENGSDYFGYNSYTT